MGRKMRLGYQRVDLGHLVDGKHFASYLLHNSRRGSIKYRTDKQYGVDRDNNCSRSPKQYSLCVSFIGHGESHEKLTTKTRPASMALSQKSIGPLMLHHL